MISIPYEIVANWPVNNVLWVQMSYHLYWESREVLMWYKNKKNHKEHTGLFHTRRLIIILNQVTILELKQIKTETAWQKRGKMLNNGRKINILLMIWIKIAPSTPWQI